MTDAEKAYAEAERLIAKEKEERTGQLDLSNDELKALSKLPSDISDLDWLNTLNLNNTQIKSLEPISTLTALMILELKNTSITDLTPLEALESLRWLNLSDTPVRELAPLSNLHKLFGLFLGNTQIGDIVQIETLKWLRRLDIDNCEITDLRPCRNFTELSSEDSFQGLFFSNILASHLDPHLHELSQLQNPQDRTRKTLDYLNSLDDTEYDAFLARRKRELGIVKGEAVAPPPKPSPTAKARAAYLAPNIYAHREVIQPLADQIQTALREWQNETGTNQLPEALQLIEHLASGFALAVKQSDTEGLEARLAYLESEGQKLATLLKQEQAKTAALSHELSEAKAAKFAPAFREEMGKRSAQMMTGGVYAFTGLGVTYLLGEAHPITKALISLISPK
ncbi:leucine-rich repeat domain-containing protein [Lentibacter sp.]|uniref:leucine-rich repeat domain-containing protein n=1 Tax=Lentibacter sp. TaxID=2024994 RepID=UPI003F6A3515